MMTSTVAPGSAFSRSLEIFPGRPNAMPTVRRRHFPPEPVFGCLEVGLPFMRHLVIIEVLFITRLKCLILSESLYPSLILALNGYAYACRAVPGTGSPDSARAPDGAETRVSARTPYGRGAPDGRGAIEENRSAPDRRRPPNGRGAPHR